MASPCVKTKSGHVLGNVTALSDAKLVREAGLEPAWPGRWILSPVRLPIPPLSQTVAQISKRAGAAQAIAPAPLLWTTAGKENSFPTSSCEFI